MRANGENISGWLLPVAIVSGVVVWTFWGTLSGLYQQWAGNGDYSYGMLILPVSLYLVWEKRKEILALTPTMDWRGLMVMAAAVGLFVVGNLGAELFTTRVSVILLFIGAIWWLYGYSFIRAIAFPLLLLFFMLPLPGFVYRSLTFPLQIFSSSLSVKILNTLGFLAYREGNVIDMGFGRFEVVEACNGLRYILPLLCIGVVLAFYSPMTWWKRTLLIVITVPLAVATNVVRIAGTGILSHYFGEDAARGFFHDFSGLAVFIACLVVFVGIASGLKRLPGKPRPRERQPEKEDPALLVNWNKRLIAVSTAVVICLASPVVVSVLGDVAPMALNKSLDTFPLELGGRTGSRSRMDPHIWQRVGGQAYTIIDYRCPGKPPIDFYTAYYEYQKKAGDFIHSPRLCLPGSGWEIRSNRVRTLKTVSPSKYGGRLRINELVIDKDGYWELVYFWYQGRERNFTSEWAAKFYMVWDGIFRRRTDGALVRLTAPLASRYQVKDVRRDMDRFAVLASRTLDEYLP